MSNSTFIEESEFNRSEVISKLILELNEKGQIRYKMLDKDNMLISHRENKDHGSKLMDIMYSIYSFLRILDKYHWENIDFTKNFTIIQE